MASTQCVALWFCWEYNALWASMAEPQTGSILAVVGYALGFEIITFLDMWFPDEIHAVIWYF